MAKFSSVDHMVDIRGAAYIGDSSFYELKYTLLKQPYGLNVKYLAPDTFFVKYYHKFYFDRDTVVVVKEIRDYINLQIKNNQPQWWEHPLVTIPAGVVVGYGLGRIR